MIGAFVSSLVLDKRETKIRSMFNNIAPSYDLLNHLLSCNVDHYWRWRTTRIVPPIISDSSTGPLRGSARLGILVPHPRLHDGADFFETRQVACRIPFDNDQVRPFSRLQHATVGQADRFRRGRSDGTQDFARRQFQLDLRGTQAKCEAIDGT
jgi:ubiE/COQ5 methyltransferase family